MLVNGGFDTGSLSPWVVSNPQNARLDSPGYNNSAYYLEYDGFGEGSLIMTLSQSGVYTIPGTEYQFYFAARYFAGGSNSPITCSATSSAGSSVVLDSATGNTGQLAWTVYYGTEYFTGVGDINVTCTFTLGVNEPMNVDDFTLIAVE